MYQFGEKHPVIFEIILTILSFLAAAVFVAAGSILNVHPDFCSSVGRIIVGATLMLLYRRAFTGIETKKNYLILLAAEAAYAVKLCLPGKQTADAAQQS